MFHQHTFKLIVLIFFLHFCACLFNYCTTARKQLLKRFYFPLRELDMWQNVPLCMLHMLIIRDFSLQLSEVKTLKYTKTSKHIRKSQASSNIFVLFICIRRLYLSFHHFLSPPHSAVFLSIVSTYLLTSPHHYCIIFLAPPYYHIPTTHSCSSSLLSAQSPTCHLFLRAIGHSCWVFVTSIHMHTHVIVPFCHSGL